MSTIMVLRTVANSLTYATCLVVGLVGCNGSFEPRAPSGTTDINSSVRTNVSSSWLAPQAKEGDLLYVADGSNKVYVYSYPRGTLTGMLTGFDGMGGMCVDRAGDIFIPSSGLQEVLEYAHGGTTPIATLSDTYGFPAACAVDPVTGNLAVLNRDSNNQYPAGNVALYRQAHGTPTIYTIPNFYLYYFDTYDQVGDLFVEGYSETGYFELAELPKARKNFRAITADKHALENGIQWQGNYLALGAATNRNTYIYHMKIHRRTGTTIGTTQLTEGMPTANFFIEGTRVIVASSGIQEDTQFFPYPAGGSATKALMETAPVGVVVSKAR